MRFLYTVLPLLGALALAQTPMGDQCQCPQAKCPASDATALCKCLNSRETMCKERCPKYKPIFYPCPYTPKSTFTPDPLSTPKPTPLSTLKTLLLPTLKPFSLLTIEPISLPTLGPILLPTLGPILFPTPKTTVSLTPKITVLPTPRQTIISEACECPQVNCVQMWPGSCHCANDAKQRCFDTCGGAKPELQDCGGEKFIARAPEADPVSEPAIRAQCTCDDVVCAQVWPNSCYCSNAAAEACAKKCGHKAALQECPLPLSSTLSTITWTPKPTSSPTSSSEPTAMALPPNPHPICGGGRSNYLSCDEGYICITDPYTPGCGPACDGLGICVKDEMCGGFAGYGCGERDMVCHDDPRDGCDPKEGGADCGGLCIVPHARIDRDGYHNE